MRKDTDKKTIFALVRIDYTAKGSPTASKEKAARMAINTTPGEADGVRVDRVAISSVFCENERPTTTTNKEYYTRRITRIEFKGPNTWRVTFSHYSRLRMYTTHNAPAVSVFFGQPRPGDTQKYETREEAAKSLYLAGVEACGYKLPKTHTAKTKTK